MRKLTLVLAILIAISLVSCGTAGETATTAAAQTSAAAESTTAAAEGSTTTAATEAATTAAAPAATTVATTAPEAPIEQRTVSVLFSNGDASDLWKQCHDYTMLQEQLGITLDYSFADQEQLGVIIASGDLPDIVCPRQRFIPAIIENNMAMDLEPIIDSHLPNLKLDYYKYSTQIAKEFLGGPDKKLFFLATMIGPGSVFGSDMSSRGYALRWDLYRDLGCPEINSDDDYIKVVQDMIALFPETPDGLPVYAMAGIDNFQWWYQRGAFIREGTTGNMWTYSGFLYSASYENMELINGYKNLDSHFWTDMRFYNKLWNLGLLDPDSFTMTSAERAEKTQAMQYVGFQTAVDDLYNEMVVQDPETKIGFVMIPSTNAVINANALAPIGGMPTDSLFINAQSDNWEAAAEVLNFYRDPEVLRVYWNGAKGVSWDYDATGKPFLTEKGINDLKTYAPGSDEFREATGIYHRNYDWTPLHSNCIHDDGYFFEIASEIEYAAWC